MVCPSVFFEICDIFTDLFTKFGETIKGVVTGLVVIGRSVIARVVFATSVDNLSPDPLGVSLWELEYRPRFL